MLTKMKRDVTGNPDAVFRSWDFFYYENLLKEKEYNVDEEKIKEYFSMD